MGTKLSQRQAGISMIEVMVTVVIANVGIAGLVASFSHYHQHEIENRAQTTALLAAQTVLESVKASDFHTLVSQYNDVPGDDPNGQDKGAFFSIPGLNPPRIAGLAQNHGEVIFVQDERPDEATYGRDLGTNGLPYPNGVPDGLPDGVDLNADGKVLASCDAFAGKFDLNLNGTTVDANLLGLYQAAQPQDAYRSLRCVIRVTYEVLGELRQVELQSQLSEPIK